jgi:hypothetical protein
MRTALFCHNSSVRKEKQALLHIPGISQGYLQIPTSRHLLMFPPSIASE